MATNEAKPNGYKYIKHGEEAHFLNPLPIEAIPGLGKHSKEFLNLRKIYFIKDLKAIGKEKLFEWFGKYGTRLWKKANGRGSVYFSPYHRRKSISHERTFFSYKTNAAELKQIVFSLTELLTHALRKEGLTASTLTLKLRTPDFKTITRQTTITPTFYDHELLPEVDVFFDKVYRNQTIRLIGVKLGGLIEHYYQTNCFDNIEKQNNLYKAIDEVKEKYGQKGLSRGVSVI